MSAAGSTMLDTAPLNGRDDSHSLVSMADGGASFGSLSTTRTSDIAKVHQPRRLRQAVVMAGGKGTRLYPYSAILPKPLMPLGDMPVLELLMRRLKSAGIDEVVLAVNHLSHLIEAYFGDGSRLDLNITYKHESRPLGTAGALANMLDDLDDTFLVTNGDLLTTLNIRRMLEAHRRSNASGTIGIYPRDVKIDFGLIEFDPSGTLTAFREKPSTRCYVSMGIYMFQRSGVEAHLIGNQHMDMPDLLLKVKQADGNIHCFNEECFWLDIGRPDDFALAQKLFEEDRKMFLES